MIALFPWCTLPFSISLCKRYPKSRPLNVIWRKWLPKDVVRRSLPLFQSLLLSHRSPPTLNHPKSHTRVNSMPSRLVMALIFLLSHPKTPNPLPWLPVTFLCCPRHQLLNHLLEAPFPALMVSMIFQTVAMSWQLQAPAPKHLFLSVLSSTLVCCLNPISSNNIIFYPTEVSLTLHSWTLEGGCSEATSSYSFPRDILSLIRFHPHRLLSIFLPSLLLTHYLPCCYSYPSWVV